MSIQVVKLQDLVDSLGQENTYKILKSFKSIPHQHQEEINDVEYFLHQKAIKFEKMALSTTYLLFITFQQKSILVGYFSLANKPLMIKKKNYEKLSNNQKRKLSQYGTRIDNIYRINSYLIGQLGKNYAPEALQTKAINGDKILTLAYQTVLNAKQLINAKYVWLECENKPKLLEFYKKFGFSAIERYESDNGLIIMIMKLHN